MPLAQIPLDDLQWDDFVAATRAGIPAASEGRWTLHAPVDPGVTLLELFAWLLEQRIYRLDQVPDPLARALLVLLGHAPKTARPAATVLAVTENQTPFRELDARAALRRLRGKPPPEFSIDDGLTLLPLGGTNVDDDPLNHPLEGIQLFVGDVERTADLDLYQRSVELFPDREVRIVFHLNDPFAAQPSHPIAFFLELAVAPKIAAQWRREAADNVKPPARLTWWYEDTVTGKREPFPDSVEDGTAGLRRSGVVRLPVPEHWKAGAQVNGLTPYSLWLRMEDAEYTYPPRLVRLVPNAAIAHDKLAISQNAKTVSDWPPLPGNTIELPAEHPPPLRDSVELTLHERDGKQHAWSPVADLAFHGPKDRVFLVDRERRLIRFGDGLTGRLPVVEGGILPDGTFGYELTYDLLYEAGGGAARNIGADLPFEGSADPAIRALNIVEASDGADPETMADALTRVRGKLKERHRAVTRADYETLAVGTGGVGIKRAHAAIGYHPCHPCTPVPGAVTVFIVPFAPRDAGDSTYTQVGAPRPDPGALEAVRSRLEARRLIGTRVFVRGPNYRAVVLDVDVTGKPADAVALRTRIVEGLGKFLDPLQGGDDGNGWPFGESLRPSALLKVAQVAAGERVTAERVSIGIDGSSAREDCTDVPIGPHDLVSLDQVEVRLTRPAARQGGLQ